MTPEPDVDFAVPVDGGELRGRVVGTGEQLLVLHGGPGMSDYSAMFVDELAGWQALTYTQRGCAPSEAPGPYDVDVHVADALAVLDHHGAAQAVVLGHSWGAFLACCLAAATPQRVRALVLVDGLGLVGDGGMAEFGAGMAARTDPAALAEIERLDDLVTRGDGGDDDALESFRLIWPAYFADPPSALPVPDGLRLSAQCYEQTFESLLAVQENGEVAAALSAFGGPVEIVYGQASPMPPSASLDTAALFANADTSEIDGAGHFPWVERPGAIADALRRLAARLPAQRAAGA